MNGGYLMISKNDSDIYAKAQKALVLGKPILFYENATTCYYIDTISGGEITTEIVDDEEITSYGDIILTKGGKTITITSANAVSESGNINEPLLENIVDSAGNKRFVEGDITGETVTGITWTYGKWSLSGSHLMIVLCGDIADTTVIANRTDLAHITLPEWIMNKLIPITGTALNRTFTNLYASDLTTQSLTVVCSKETDYIKLYSSSLTITADRSARIQFDFLIDNDYSE